MSAETPLMRELQIEASRLGARLFRQNTGMAWVGKVRRIARAMKVQVGAGDVVISGARPFHAGIAGMSDLGGWVPVVVTPEMVGSTVAVYAQVEVKDGGRATAEQLRWIEAVGKAGGLAGIARNAADLRSILAAKAVPKE